MSRIQVLVRFAIATLLLTVAPLAAHTHAQPLGGECVDSARVCPRAAG